MAREAMKKMLPGILCIAAVYFYFLIFAQFSFLSLLESRALSESSLKLVMGMMALGGIAGSLLFMFSRSWSWRVIIKAAALACSLTALLAIAGTDHWGFGIKAFCAVSLSIGLSLGMLTACLATHLDRLTPHAILAAGAGTGIAYCLSNVPAIFQASAQVQGFLAAGTLLSVTLIPLRQHASPSTPSPQKAPPFLTGLVWFTMLVWLDSAAFFIIQHNYEIQQATWGEVYLWRNAIVHLVVALLTGWALTRGKIVITVFRAFALLSIAALMSSIPALRIAAGVLYPVGVSLYSVALIIYPAVWLGTKGGAQRAAILFAIAGWIGSALGIGMAQDLQHVPTEFIAITFPVMLTPFVWNLLRHRLKEVATCSLFTLLIWGIYTSTEKPTLPSRSEMTGIELGQKVYIQEGCIHCHSRYVRPNTTDTTLWGPYKSPDKVLLDQPVLIGNRRQGPDLLNVGLRRSRSWMKQHFISPQSLAPYSSMPSYSYLFDDDRGEALLDFLCHTSPSALSERIQAIYDWRLTDVSRAQNPQQLFKNNCAMCHGDDALGDGPLAKLWHPISPPNLRTGPFTYTALPEPDSAISRAIKFGIPGTNMPGHESLTDSEISALTQYIKNLRK